MKRERGWGALAELACSITVIAFASHHLIAPFLGAEVSAGVTLFASLFAIDKILG